MNRHSPSPALALAAAALLISLAGTATAAVLVTSKQIKDGTIQLVDISKRARTGLSGNAAGALEGSWQFTVTQTGPGSAPPFQGRVAFAAGGSVVEANQRNQSAGIGTWRKIDERHYQWTFVRYRFNSAGVFTGTASVVENDTLDQSKNEYDGTSTVELRDPSGAVIGGGPATTHGTRVGS